MFGKDKDIPDETWFKAVAIVLAEMRSEFNDPNWEPKLLNGAREFHERVSKLSQQMMIDT